MTANQQTINTRFNVSRVAGFLRTWIKADKIWVPYLRSTQSQQGKNDKVQDLQSLQQPNNLKCSAIIGIGFNGAETNCGIARILGILLMNSCDT